MKYSKNGFTLIELLVVIAIIGILATTLAPKLREQLAKGYNAKTLAGIGSFRTAFNVLAFDKFVLKDDSSTSIQITLDELKNKVDSKTAVLIADDGSLETGGGRMNRGGKVIYGPSKLDSTTAPTNRKTLISLYTGDPVSHTPLTNTRPLTITSSYLEDPQLNMWHRGSAAVYSIEGKEWKSY